MDKKYRCYYHKKGESNQERDWKWKDLTADSITTAKALVMKEFNGKYIVDRLVRWAK